MKPLGSSREFVLTLALIFGLIPSSSYCGEAAQASGDLAAGEMSPGDVAAAAGNFFNSAAPDMNDVSGMLSSLGDPNDAAMGTVKDVVQLAAKALVNEKEPDAGFSQRELLVRTAKLHALEHVFRPYLDQKSRSVDRVLQKYAQYHRRLDARHLATMERWAAVLNPAVKDSAVLAGASSASSGKMRLPLRPAAAGLKAGDAFNEKKIGLAAKFISITPGEFEMGSPADQAERYNDETPHAVKLTRGFEMQAAPVTQLQYFLVMGSNPSKFKARENGDSDFETINGQALNVSHPVETVSWDEAQEFVKRVNQIQSKYTYRLPTEAEWEYAARAGTPAAYPYSFGYNGYNNANELNNHAWHGGNSGNRTHAVAGKAANPWGLYDMNGNVYQWVQDWYGDYPKGSVTDPTGPTAGSLRVVRGGSWISLARYLRSARRSYGGPGIRRSSVGFRLVRSSR